MADITCPECGLVTALASIRRSAEEFCRHCDYPLFWAPTAGPLAVEAAASDATLRRLPGAGGRMLIGTHVCPSCGELNPMSEVWCIRCGSPLRPEPVAAPIPEPLLIAPTPEPELVKSRWWLWVLLAIVAGILSGVIIITML